MQTHFKPGTPPARVRRAARRLARKAIARMDRSERKRLAALRIPTSVEGQSWQKAFASAMSRPLVVLPLWLTLMILFPDGLVPMQYRGRRANAKTAA